MLIYKGNMMSVSTYFAISNMYIQKTKNKYFNTYLLIVIYKSPLH
jgi:hypothetical protein